MSKVDNGVDTGAEDANVESPSAKWAWLTFNREYMDLDQVGEVHAQYCCTRAVRGPLKTLECVCHPVHMHNARQAKACRTGWALQSPIKTDVLRKNRGFGGGARN